MDISIDELAMRSKNGDEDATLLLIDVLAPIRKNLCRKFFYLDSEDLNQDLTVVLLECVFDFDGRSSFQWFVRERSRFFCLDRVKSMRNVISIEEYISDDMKISDILVSDCDLESDCEATFFSSRVRDLLNDLGERERDVIFYYFYMGLSLSEIGEILDLSVGSVSRIKSSAIRFLKRRLSDYK